MNSVNIIYACPKAKKDKGNGNSINCPVDLNSAIEKAKKNPNRCVIYLLDGIYHFKDCLKINAELSGISFRALNAGSVFWSGGIHIQNFVEKPASSLCASGNKNQKIWVADVGNLSLDPETLKFLHVNGEHRYRCRYPYDAPGHGTKTESHVSCTLAPALAGAIDNREAELVLYYDWVCRRLKISEASPDGIQFVPDQTRRGKKTKYYIENVPVEYLSPGCWKYMPEKNLLVYMPKEGEVLAESRVFLSLTPQLLEIGNESEDYVEAVSFYGIIFCHTGDSRLINSNQAEVNCSAAVVLQKARNCYFEHCEFRDTSGWGLEFGSGCHDHFVSQCKFENTGAGGIKILGTNDAQETCFTGRVSIKGNVFAGGGRIWNGAVAILICHSAGNEIIDNEIFDYDYSGISCGWVWGYAENPSRDNIISGNHIHGLGRNNLLVDMGAIYTLGNQPGTVINGNLIHDIPGELITWGIYLDEGSSNISVTNNIVYNIGGGCFHIHYGRDNLIKNNIFAWGKSYICSITRGTMDINCNFTAGDKAIICEENLMISDGSPFYLKYILDYAIKEDFLSCIASNNNMFCNTGEEEAVFGADGFHNVNKTYEALLGFSEWKNAGLDRDSTIVSDIDRIGDELNERIERLSPIFDTFTRLVLKTEPVIRRSLGEGGRN